MAKKRIQSVDDLFQLAQGQWTRVEGGLPTAHLSFAVTVLVRRGGREQTLHGRMVTNATTTFSSEGRRTDTTLAPAPSTLPISTTTIIPSGLAPTAA
jgi:hypothetical protein